MFLIFLHKVWAWLKKYWKWLLFPVGILLGILSMLGGKKIGNVVAPEAVKAEEERIKHELEAQKKAEQAEALRKGKVEFIEREHAKTLEKLTDDQKARVEELREDPDELNGFLIGVGKDIRG